MSVNKKYNFDDELEKKAPRLSSIQDKNMFKVPDGYFEEQLIRIKNKISGEETNSFLHMLLNWFRKPVNSLSVISISILLIVFFILKQDTMNTDKEIFIGVTLEQVLEECPELIENMDEDIFFDVLFVNSDEGETLFMESQVRSDSSLSGDDILNYLIDEELIQESI